VASSRKSAEPSPPTDPTTVDAVLDAIAAFTADQRHQLASQLAQETAHFHVGGDLPPGVRVKRFHLVVTRKVTMKVVENVVDSDAPSEPRLRKFAAALAEALVVRDSTARRYLAQAARYRRTAEVLSTREARRKRKPDSRLIEEVLQLREEGKTLEEVADELNIGVAAVRARIRRHNHTQKRP
jgi:DNA-binding NarL/FixJ family response regulator